MLALSSALTRFLSPKHNKNQYNYPKWLTRLGEDALVLAVLGMKARFAVRRANDLSKPIGCVVLRTVSLGSSFHRPPGLGRPPKKKDLADLELADLEAIV